MASTDQALECLATWRVAAFALVFVIATNAFAADLATPSALQPVPVHDRKVIAKWALDGTPHGIAVGADGRVYVGLARPQKVVAIDPDKGTIVAEVTLDHVEIASTKDLRTLRTTADGKHLVIANGSDESATILAIPSLEIVREIGLEGEPIRDALPDPKGRYIYLLGRTVHVYSADGEEELKSVGHDPMALAASSDGKFLVVVESEEFPTGRASVAVLYETSEFKEVAREPLQTEKTIDSILFAAGDGALVFFASDWMGEKSLHAKAEKTMQGGGTVAMRMTIDFGDLVNSQGVCLPDHHGPEIATGAGAESRNVYFAEKRCSEASRLSASERQIVPASLYGTSAFAIAYDSARRSLFATDPAGSLTRYKLPQPEQE